VARSEHSTAETLRVYGAAGVASVATMSDHPGFLATNHCHKYKRVSTNRSNHSSPLQKKKANGHSFRA